MKKIIPLFLALSACATQPSANEADAPDFPNPEAAIPLGPAALTENTKPSVPWDRVRVQLERAIESGHRGSGVSYSGEDQEAWVRNMDTLEQRAQMYAYLALGEDGSYTDLVIPSIGDLIGVYREAGLDPKTDAQNRARIARIMVADLLFVLTKLDEQIKAYHECTERLKSSDVTSSIQASLCPGFYSTQVEVQLENRDWNAYHLRERTQLESKGGELKQIETLNDIQLRVILQNFPERIRPYFE